MRIMEDIVENIAHVRAEIGRAAARRGRDPGEITLIAVTKNVLVDKINAAVEAGITDIGENRVQEALQKQKEVVGPVKWHFIGHLQRNKVKDSLTNFALFHSLDRIALAREIQKRAEQKGVVVPCLVQVNVAGEESKFGLPPGELEAFLRQVAVLNNIKVCGLMTIAPYYNDPEAARPVFRRLRELFEQENYPAGVSMRYLSMGMSNDYTVAVEEGANMVRIGTAIFGKRKY
jgi:pyridoxal phosphate enzyme (YggS family)